AFFVSFLSLNCVYKTYRCADKFKAACKYAANYHYSTCDRSGRNQRSTSENGSNSKGCPCKKFCSRGSYVRSPAAGKTFPGASGLWHCLRYLTKVRRTDVIYSYIHS